MAAAESDSILSGCPDNGTKSLICVGRQQKLFFSQLHTIVKLFFNDIVIFETRHQYQLQPGGDITVCVEDHRHYFEKLVKQTQRQDFR